MNCELFRDKIVEYLEGALPEGDAEAVEQHQEACADCQSYSADFEKFEQFLTTFADEDEVPDYLEKRLLAVAEPARAPAGRVVPFRKMVFALAAAAAVIVSTVVIWRAIQPDTVTTRLYANRMAGRPVPNATYRIYGNEISKIFHDLQLLNRRGSRSWNNLTLRASAPHTTVTADASGRLQLDEPLDGPRLAIIEKPGYLAAWGIVEPVGDTAPPTQDVVLYPGKRYAVEGTLIDRTTKRPLSGAFVATLDGTGVARTKEDGSFRGDFMFAESATAELFALAEGYAQGKVVVPAASGSDTFLWNSGLAPSLRPSADVTLVDGSGNAVPRTLALAYPAPEDAAQRNRIPLERRDKPEVAMSGTDGKLVFHNLFDCPYRLEVLQGGSDVSGEMFQPHTKTTVALRPAGKTRLRVNAQREGVHVAARVLFTPTVSDGMRPASYVEGTANNEGLVSFHALSSGPGTVRIYTPEGLAFFVTFTIPPSEVADFDYPMPETPHLLAGRVSNALRGRLITLRLTGDVAPITIGGSSSSAHRFVVETPVGPDGRFAFPPLPSLTNAMLSGRRTADPYGTPGPLKTTTPLDTLLTKGRPGSEDVRVQAPE